MSSLNSEKLIREDLINNILHSEALIEDENNFQFHLKTNSEGKIQNISADGTDFINQHFGIVLKVDAILFDIIPTEFLKDFLVCFKNTLGGCSSRIYINSISGNQIIRFHFESHKDTQKDIIDILISKTESDNIKVNAINTSQELNILNQTSQVFESLFNNHPDAVYSFDLEGNFISANDSACKMAEVSNSELLKHSFLPLIPEKDQERVLKHFLNAVKGEFQNYNTGMRGFKGTDIIINITNFPIIINGKTTGVFGIAKDITEAELNKKYALKLEKRYKTILDQSLDVICTIDKDGCFVHINETCFEMWGYEPEELYGKSYMEFVVQEDWESTAAVAQEIMGGENKTNFSNRYMKKEGSIVPMVWSVRWVEEEQLNYCIGKNASEMNAVLSKLEEERNILRAIIENIPDYIFVKNRKDELILANKSFYSDYLGYKNEAELLNLKPSAYLSEDYAREVMEDNMLVMENEQIVTNRRDIVKDYLGKQEVILLSKVPFKRKDGEVIGLVGIARNITENYEFEQEQLLISRLNETLGAAENLQEGLFETIQILSEYFGFDYAQAWEVGMIDDRLNNIATYQSKAEDSVHSKAYRDLKNTNIPKETLELCEIKIWDDLNSQVEISNSIAVGVPIVFDKKVIQIFTFYGCINNRSHKLIKDIFHRIRIQIASGIQRKITESQLNNLFKNSPTLITNIGLDGYMKKVSPSFTKIFGFSEEELLSTPYQDFLHPDEVNLSFERLKEVSQGYKSKSFEGRCRTKDGEWKWISWTPSEIISDDGIINLFGLDITDRKNHEKELAVSNAELEQFAYIASHDLQEPLRMVTSFLTQLNKKYKDQLDPKAQQYIYYATDGAKRMREILLDLLEYSRVGSMDYQLEEIDLNLMLEEIIKFHKDLISEASGKIIYKNLPKFYAASSPLQRILSNLITNALKYQKPNVNAEIKIDVLEKDEFWQINVQDNGIGIEEQFFERIFEVFQRLHSKEQYSGTGIGLAICRKIVENHGGKMWVTSKINEGSTFHFTIRRQN